MRTLNFGKYKGMKLEEIAKMDSGYLDWLKKKSDPKDPKYGKYNQGLIHDINTVLANMEADEIMPDIPKKTPLTQTPVESLSNAVVFERIANALERIAKRLELNDDPLEKTHRREQQKVPF